RTALRPHVRRPPHARGSRLCGRPPAAVFTGETSPLGREPRVMKSLRALVPILILLAAWEAAARSGMWSKIVFPSLEAIGGEFIRFFARADAWEQIWTSLYRAFGGFGLAAVAGVLLGMVMGRSKIVADMLDPLFSGTYAVPKLALFPIFIFVFGIGSLSKVALIFLECLYPIVIMTYHGAS